MKFEINGTEWIIRDVDEATINNEMKQDGTLGCTIYKKQEILLLKDQANVVKTLKHELTHVWMYEYGHTGDDDTTYNHEDVCEIVASINDFINEIVNRYLGIEPFYHCDKDLNTECDKKNCGFCTLTSNPKYAIRKEYSNEYKSKH